MNSLIIPISYLGPISTYIKIKPYQFVKIEAHENYQKRSHRNRCNVNSIKGALTLSIPLLKGKHTAQNIKDVSIAYHQDWIKDHLRQIEINYSKSAFFSFYFPEIKKILETNYNSLFKLDTDLLKWSFDKLNWDKTISYTNEYKGPQTDSIITFSNAYKEYPQVYDSKIGFIENLSILDLIMNVGPEANYYL